MIVLLIVGGQLGLLSKSKATLSHTMRLSFSETKTKSSNQESVTVDTQTVLVDVGSLQTG